MSKRQICVVLIGVGLAGLASKPAPASVLPFTWNPAGAVPALAAPGSSFTADTILVRGFLRDVAQPDGTGAAREIGVVTGFSLQGHAVSPAGFGSLYGLYFDITDTHISGPPPEILDFTSLDVALKADPGNHNGAALAT